MIIKKNKFYVFSYEGDGTLSGIQADGKKIIDKKVEIVLFNTQDDFETSKEGIREATELEKQYWLESVQIVDESDIKEEIGAVSLCDFEEWKKSKNA